ncbi:GNAT family N-acetyltransferase [Paenibacillus sp. YN15]|uniref:GNAT family N-acetyltransferase n=1 Tax=Paenibacillus sp. YN15 TaxID=1742774 RepID=UPI000DCDE45D|nr:GNAT family N-acetyltransferase [Paenibacillus sp. YN15]RAV05629.1 GNAT family N-acetyltransferase [Paenibacillus sp. YN15]
MTAIKPIEAEHQLQLSRLLEELTGAKADPAVFERTFRMIQRNEHYVLFGAYHNGELAGTAMGIVCMDLTGACRPFMVVENVVVSANRRKLGLGRQLMLAMEEQARKRNCYYIILVSGKHRVEAHRLYESLGYRDEGAEGFRKHLD